MNLEIKKKNNLKKNRKTTKGQTHTAKTFIQINKKHKQKNCFFIFCMNILYKLVF